MGSGSVTLESLGIAITFFLSKNMALSRDYDGFDPLALA
jgi:hypothetical protein